MKNIIFESVLFLYLCPMQIQTRGIILRTVKYAESSIIADVFTEELGLRHYIISGVRARNARVSAGLMQVMSLIELVAYEKPGSGLTRLKEVRPAFVYSTVPFEVKRSAIGLFMAEMAQKTIKETESNEALFHCLFDAFTWLDTAPKLPLNLHLHFALELASILGFMPSGEWSEETPFFDMLGGEFVAECPVHPHVLDGEISKKWSDLLYLSREEASYIACTLAIRKELLHRIIEYYKLHIDYFKGGHSHLILEEVLS